MTTHPLVRAAVVHYEIEFIHPFSDGNGRMGRLWQHVVLTRCAAVFEHVPFESIIEQRQAEYYRVRPRLHLFRLHHHRLEIRQFGIRVRNDKESLGRDRRDRVGGERQAWSSRGTDDAS